MQVAYSYPTSAELFLIEQELMPRLEEGRVGFELLPRVSRDADLIEWEQRDNYVGLQQVRGLNGQPGSVQKTGASRFSMRPGYYGDFVTIDEEDLTRRRKLGEFGEPINIDDLVGPAEIHLLQRELDRIEAIIFTLLTTGTFSIANAQGVIHTDTFPIKTFTSSTPWLANLTSAVPLQDIRTVQLNQRGQSARYDRSGRMLMNLKTANGLLNNSNAIDIGAKFRLQYGETIATVDQINVILQSNDLPKIEVYDAGYFLTKGAAFTPFIPDSKVIVVGTRPAGQTIGEYQMTRNANNPDLGPGGYSLVIDSLERRGPPRTIEVHRGHNGGPTIEFPGAITVMNV